MITELFYSRILTMKRGSLQKRSFRLKRAPDRTVNGLAQEHNILTPVKAHNQTTPFLSDMVPAGGGLIISSWNAPEKFENAIIIGHFDLYLPS